MSERSERLCFVVNQGLLDGSAHALYCVRHCWWLAKVAPECAVELLFPGREGPGQILSHFGLEPLPNFQLKGFPAVRRKKGAAGITVNAVYHLSLLLHFRRARAERIILATASFPRLFSFLLSRHSIRSRATAIFEVHQLASLEERAEPSKIEFELNVLRASDVLITTTHALADLLRQQFADAHIHHVGLACGFDAALVPPITPAADGAFRLGYIGSLYPEQGMDWLLENWTELRAGQPRKLQLEVFGGPVQDASRLAARISSAGLESVFLRGAVPPSQLLPHLAQIDALIIPTLANGRMPFVALTKAYDYLGLNRPIIASDLPSIREVIGETEGFLYRAGDASDLKAALRRLLSDPQSAESMNAYAAHRGRELSWEKRAHQWWDHVQSELKGNNP